MKLIIKTLAGLEEVLAGELAAIGAAEIIQGKRAVECEGDQKLLYRANLELRTALRVLMPIHAFEAEDEAAFYEHILQMDWAAFMDVDDTLAVDAVTFSKHFPHSQYIALKTKDAIVDHFREKTGRRPSVDTEAPNIRISVHVADTHCSVSLDSSGDSLHKRGYRQEGLTAPINEVLAAGMLLLSGWKRDCAFVDPMCGSGTLPIEAALYARNIPPQWYREQFSFMRWSDFDPMLWAEVRTEARERMTDFSHPIYGFDKNFRAIQAAEANAMAAHLEGKIHFERRRFETLTPPVEKGLLMMNPPYDARLNERDIEGLYEMIGDRLKQVFKGYTAWMISANMEALKHLGLRPSRRIPLFNGPLECRFVQVELYEGSKKVRDEEDRRPYPSRKEGYGEDAPRRFDEGSGEERRRPERRFPSRDSSRREGYSGEKPRRFDDKPGEERRRPEQRFPSRDSSRREGYGGEKPRRFDDKPGEERRRPERRFPSRDSSRREGYSGEKPRRFDDKPGEERRRPERRFPSRDSSRREGYSGEKPRRFDDKPGEERRRPERRFPSRDSSRREGYSGEKPRRFDDKPGEERRRPERHFPSRDSSRREGYSGEKPRRFDDKPGEERRRPERRFPSRDSSRREGYSGEKPRRFDDKPGEERRRPERRFPSRDSSRREGYSGEKPRRFDDKPGEERRRPGRPFPPRDHSKRYDRNKPPFKKKDRD